MSKLRPIRPLSPATMRAITPAPVSDEKPEFLWVDPQSLLVEEDYQRNLGERSVALIRRIVADWDWTRMKPPIVAAGPDGSLYVIDGQHTAIAAATHGGVRKIPVMCVKADQVSKRARAFLGHNRDRVAVTPTQMHFALLAAGDEIAVAMDAACRKAGAVICRGQPRDFEIGETIAVASIRDIVELKGPPGGARVLKCLIDAKRAPLASIEIKAAAFLLFDREACVSEYDLSTVIRSQPREEWERIAHRRREHLNAKINLWRALTLVWRDELARSAKVAA